MPSMLIRSDGLLAKPYPQAHNFEKLLSSARAGGALPQGYTHPHMHQDRDTPQDQGQPGQSVHTSRETESGA